MKRFLCWLLRRHALTETWGMTGQCIDGVTGDLKLRSIGGRRCQCGHRQTMICGTIESEMT